MLANFLGVLPIRMPSFTIPLTSYWDGKKARKKKYKDWKDKIKLYLQKIRLSM
jgi:hypothetical protein